MSISGQGCDGAAVNMAFGQETTAEREKPTAENIG
jgi:hypothetical protein